MSHRSTCFIGALLLGCSSSESDNSTRDVGPAALPGEQASPPGFGNEGAQNPNTGGSNGSFDQDDDAPSPNDPSVPAGLTPNGDGTFRDSRGTRVRLNADGQLVDDQGNLVIVDENGIVVPLNPELEVETSFRVPVVTGRLIWAANPASGRVALVDALSHDVQTLPAGLQPAYLAAVPGSGPNRALVINAGSFDATLFRDGAGDTLEQIDVPIHQSATAWSLSESGRYAIAWSDARDFGPLDPTEGLQDVTLIDLTKSPLAPARFSVGRWWCTRGWMMTSASTPGSPSASRTIPIWCS